MSSSSASSPSADSNGGDRSSASSPESNSWRGDSQPQPPSVLGPNFSIPQFSFLKKKSIVAGAGAGAGVLLLLLTICCCICFIRRKRRRNASHGESNNRPKNGNNGGYYNYSPGGRGIAMMSMDGSQRNSPGIGYNQSSFTYNELAAATEGFSEANVLGQGGFGYVHKGVLPTGKEIAVKSMKANSGQGEREFQAEVDIISRVHHRHLVSLVGYCIAGSQRMLVYEFVSNRTLEYHLHAADRATMDWPLRFKIAVGAAKGFAYLHEDCHPRIIHRDIKAANILIDAQFEAKVADFGLAKLSSDTNTHVSTRVMGTFGYMAPEYASSGKLTDKSDVYSFGIMLLEFITGRRPIDLTRDEYDDTLVDWARPVMAKALEGGSFEELVDPRLGNNYDPQEMLRMVHCAAASTRYSARQRPKMSKLVRILEGSVSLDDLNEGMKPGHGSMQGSSSSSASVDYYSRRVVTKSDAISSQEFSSGDQPQKLEH